MFCFVLHAWSASNVAYETLSDPTLRAEYDRHGHNPFAQQSKPSSSSFHADDLNAFSSMFGNRKRGRQPSFSFSHDFGDGFQDLSGLFEHAFGSVFSGGSGSRQRASPFTAQRPRQGKAARPRQEKTKKGKFSRTKAFILGCFLSIYHVVYRASSV